MAEPATPRRLIRRIGAYGLASGFGLGMDMTLLGLLVTVFHVHYLIAATISFICAGAVVYALSIWWVFDNRRITSRTLEFSSFMALGGAGLIVNATVMHIAVAVLALNLMVGKVLAAGFTFCMNFLLRQHLLFPSAAPASPQGDAQASAEMSGKQRLKLRA
jgi:putative flippase GtrA